MNSRNGMWGVLLTMGLVAGWMPEVRAGNFIWDGGGAPDNNWSTGANWYNADFNNQKPSAGDNAYIAYASSTYPRQATSVVTQAGEVCNGINLAAGVENTYGRLHINGGQLTCGTLIAGAPYNSSATAFGEVVQDGGSLNATFVMLGYSYAKGTGAYELANGVATIGTLFVGRAG